MAPRSPRRLVFMAIAAALLGCSASNRAALTRFPIGIYGADKPEYLARLRADGFDSFHTYERNPKALAALATEAKRQGMRMVVYPDQVGRSDSPTTKTWPVDAWYLVDEPDVARMSHADLQGLSDKTRAWDPERPETFVIGQGTAAAVYGGVGDIVMLDWYPVPHKPLDSIADQIDTAAAGLPKGKPLWMVVQAYDWADEITDPIKRRGLRFPDFNEIRFMTYLSVVHGAHGIFFFTLHKLSGTLFDYPELWQAVERVAWELKGMQPIFEGGTRIATPFTAGKGLEGMAWRYRLRDYVIVSNRSSEAAPIPAVLADKEWRPLFETRRHLTEILPTAAGSLVLPPFRVIVLESRLRL